MTCCRVESSSSATHPPRAGPAAARAEETGVVPRATRLAAPGGNTFTPGIRANPARPWPVRGPSRTGAPSCAPPQTARAGPESRLPGRAERAGLGGARRAPLHRRRRRLPGRPSRAPRSRPAPRAPLQPAATVTRAHPRPGRHHPHRSQGDARRHTPPPPPEAGAFPQGPARRPRVRRRLGHPRRAEPPPLTSGMGGLLR